MSYEDYVFDNKHMQDYLAYQSRYADKMRESDKILLETILRGANQNSQDVKTKLIDIGCSTGNLLLHIKRSSKDFILHGADLAPDIIQSCKNDPELKGIEFHELDMLNILEKKPDLINFDIVVLNAALCFFTKEEFYQALQQIYSILSPSGKVYVFDWMHPYEQDLEIVETTSDHPNGLKFYFRSYSTVTKTIERIGFKSHSYKPFYIPMDIGEAENYGKNQSYSVLTNKDIRLSFRGILNQPWCFLELHK